MNEQINPDELLFTPEADENQTNTLVSYLRFTALRYSANIEWVGGAIAGNWLNEAHNVNSWAAALVVATGVTVLEIPQSNYANKHIDQDESELSYSLKAEASAAASASWQGSAPTVELNDSLGLRNTRGRRLAQSAIYGTAVSLWVTPIPGFSHGADAGKNILETAIENPVQSFGLFAATSAAVYAGIKGIKKFRLRNKDKDLDE